MTELQYLEKQSKASLRRPRCFPFALFLLPFALLTWPWPSSAQESSGVLSPKDVVKPQVFVSLAAVPRGRTFELAVVGKIQPGYHINAHKVLDDYLIPTELSIELPEGFRLLDNIYPPAQLLNFSFSKDKLAVYTGSATIRMRIEAGAKAPLGEQKLALVLRYQACNDTTCLPPVKLPLTAEVQVAAAGATAKPLHPEIFAAAGSKTGKEK